MRPTSALAYALVALVASFGLPACGAGGDIERELAGFDLPYDPGPPGPTMGEDELALARACFALVNLEREEMSLPAYAWDDKAAQVAYEHSVDMDVRGFFSHENPDDQSPGARLYEAGIKFRACGENIYRSWPSDPPEKAMHVWMNSDGHRANILDQGFVYIGIGVHLSREASWWTQNFFRL